MEQHVFAYYLANGAEDFATQRFFPYGELVMMIQDKVQVGVRKYGVKANSAAPAAARHLLDLIIEKGGFSTTKNKFGGSMHQYQADTYKSAVRQLQDADPIVQQARAAGPGFWDEAFAAAAAA
jgi:hypothetical protein